MEEKKRTNPLTQQEIEQHLQSALAAVTPDIWAKLDLRVSQDLESKTAVDGADRTIHVLDGKKGHRAGRVTRLQKRLQNWGIAAACVCLVVLGGAYYYEYVQVASIIGIDINPSLMLSLNRRERVVKAEALNQDGEELMDSSRLKGKRLDAAVNQVVDSLVEKGYLSENQKTQAVLLSVSGKDKETAEKLKTTVTDNMESAISQKQVNAVVYDQTIQVTEELEELAQNYQVSVGKAEFVGRLIEENQELSQGGEQAYEQMMNQPMEELAQEIDKNSYYVSSRVTIIQASPLEEKTGEKHIRQDSDQEKPEEREERQESQEDKEQERKEETKKEEIEEEKESAVQETEEEKTEETQKETENESEENKEKPAEETKKEEGKKEKPTETKAEYKEETEEAEPDGGTASNSSEKKETIVPESSRSDLEKEGPKEKLEKEPKETEEETKTEIKETQAEIKTTEKAEEIKEEETKEQTEISKKPSVQETKEETITEETEEEKENKKVEDSENLQESQEVISGQNQQVQEEQKAEEEITEETKEKETKEDDQETEEVNESETDESETDSAAETEPAETYVDIEEEETVKEEVNETAKDADDTNESDRQTEEETRELQTEDSLETSEEISEEDLENPEESSPDEESVLESSEEETESESSEADTETETEEDYIEEETKETEEAEDSPSEEESKQEETENLLKEDEEKESEEEGREENQKKKKTVSQVIRIHGIDVYGDEPGDSASERKIGTQITSSGTQIIFEPIEKKEWKERVPMYASQFLSASSRKLLQKGPGVFEWFIEDLESEEEGLMYGPGFADLFTNP